MRKVMAHELVAATAREMASALYEELAQDNGWYKANPDLADFVERTRGSLLTQARAVLAGMLNKPALPDEQKDLILEALVLDNELPRARIEVLNEFSDSIAEESRSRAKFQQH